MFALLARTSTVRTVVRAGACGTAPRACLSRELLDRFKGLRPTIVGSAWGFFLQRRTAIGTARTPVLSMRNFTGKRGEWWAAGSTIQQVLDHEKQTFPSHPSHDDITIGAWFATGSHGSSGDAGKSSSSVLHSAEVVCFDPPSVVVCDYKQLRAIFDKPNNHVITWIKFHNLVPNISLQKRAFDVVDGASAESWLARGAVLRVLFVGAARDGLGIRWEHCYEETRHVDPHCCSKCCTFFRADVCSACGGCKENYASWNGVTTLREANRWTPPIIPLETFVAVLGGYINFEFVFRVPEMTAAVLVTMLQMLRRMHRDIGGRTEIRYGTSVVFWDLSLQGSFERPFQLLRTLGVTRVALHPGKAQPNINMIPIVSIGDIYFDNVSNVSKLLF